MLRGRSIVTRRRASFPWSAHLCGSARASVETVRSVGAQPLAIASRTRGDTKASGDRSRIWRSTLCSFRDRLEGLDAAFGEIVHPGACLGDRGQQRLDRLWIEIGLGRWLPGDALSRAGARRRPRQLQQGRPGAGYFESADPPASSRSAWNPMRRPSALCRCAASQNDVVHVQRHKVAIGELRRRRWARDSRVDHPETRCRIAATTSSSISGAEIRATSPASAFRFCSSACET